MLLTLHCNVQVKEFQAGESEAAAPADQAAQAQQAILLQQAAQPTAVSLAAPVKPLEKPDPEIYTVPSNFHPILQSGSPDSPDLFLTEPHLQVSVVILSWGRQREFAIALKKFAGLPGVQLTLTTSGGFMRLAVMAMLWRCVLICL